MVQHTLGREHTTLTHGSRMPVWLQQPYNAVRATDQGARPCSSGRMLPCFPAPRELQVFEQSWEPVFIPGRLPPRYIFHGQLSRLGFPNQLSTVDSRPETLRKSRFHDKWLTFGSIHDLAAAAWFESTPERAVKIQFDFTFNEEVLSYSNGIKRYSMWQESLRKRLPSISIGGAGQVLVMIEYHS
jgi:hypothetical protein